MNGMDYYKMFADSIEYTDENWKPVENKIEFIDEELSEADDEK